MSCESESSSSVEKQILDAINKNEKEAYRDSKLKSEVWNSFSKLKFRNSEINVEFVQCNICKTK